MRFGCAHDQGTARIGLQCLNSFDEPLSVTQRYPDLLEIGFRQICKHIGVDRVLGERCLITCEAQVAQPVANFHTDTRDPFNLIIILLGVRVNVGASPGEIQQNSKQEGTGYWGFFACGAPGMRIDLGVEVVPQTGDSEQAASVERGGGVHRASGPRNANLVPLDLGLRSEALSARRALMSLSAANRGLRPSSQGAAGCPVVVRFHFMDMPAMRTR